MIAIDKSMRPTPTDHRVLACGLLGWLLSAPILFLLYRSLPASPDQSIFDYIAWQTSQGALPYSGSFEVNWPGMILIHILAQSLFGAVDTTIRSFDYLIMQVSTLAFSALLWRNGQKLAATLIVLLYPPLYITAGLWIAGQRDIVAAELMLIACLLVSGRHRYRVGLVLAGGLLAMAFAIRPTYLSFLCGVVLLEFLVPEDRNRAFAARLGSALAIAAGAVLVVGSLVVLGWSTGTLAAWYQAAVQYAIFCYGTQNPPQSMLGTLAELLLHSWAWLFAFALLGGAVWALRRDVSRIPILLIGGVIASCVLSYFAQHKGFGYHLGGLIPAFAILLCAGIDGLWQAGRTNASLGLPRAGRFLRFAFAGLAGLIIVLSAGGTLAKLHRSTHLASSPIFGLTMEDPGDSIGCEAPGVAHATAAFIERSLQPGETILPVNCGYRAAFLARHRAVSRFATSTSFGARSGTCPLNERLMQDYAREIANNPALILGSTADFDPTTASLTLAAKHSPMAAEVVAVLPGYHKVATFGKLLVFSRN